MNSRNLSAFPLSLTNSVDVILQCEMGRHKDGEIEGGVVLEGDEADERKKREREEEEEEEEVGGLVELNCSYE